MGWRGTAGRVVLGWLNPTELRSDFAAHSSVRPWGAGGHSHSTATASLRP